MQSYSQEIRETMVAKLCTPGGPGYTQLSLESGIATSTFHTWVQKYLLLLPITNYLRTTRLRRFFKDLVGVLRNKLNSIISSF